MQENEDFIHHLEELRKRLLISLAAIGAITAGAWFFSRPLLEFFTLPVRRFGGGELYFHTPYEAFVAHLAVAGLVGLLAGSPVLLAELWLFIAPGLYPKERRVVVPLALISILLFLGGAAFGYAVVAPLGLQFFLGYRTESLVPLLGIGPYFSFLIGVVMAGGVLFVLPVVILGLVRAGILDHEKLRRWRKVAIVLIFVIAAVLTPPDPVSQLLLAVPLVVIYEASVFAAKRFARK